MRATAQEDYQHDSHDVRSAETQGHETAREQGRGEDEKARDVRLRQRVGALVGQTVDAVQAVRRSQNKSQSQEHPDVSRMNAEPWEQVRHGFSHRLRSAHTWIVCEDSISSFLRDAQFGCPVRLEPVVGGIPLHCTDVRAAAKQAHENDELLLVDNTLATSFGCATSRLGAHVTIELMDRVLQQEHSGLMAVSVSRDARVPDALIWSQLDRLEAPSKKQLLYLHTMMRSFDGRRRDSNDNAQVVGFYLACHPAVVSIMYPGMPHDPSYPVASQILTNGFGPCVDFAVAPSASDKLDHVLALSGKLLGDWKPGSAVSKLERLKIETPHKTWLRLTCGTGDVRELIQEIEYLLALL